jgi:hypothetical protein
MAVVVGMAVVAVTDTEAAVVGMAAAVGMAVVAVAAAAAAAVGMAVGMAATRI